jgi:hypothetical protein
MLLHYHIDNLSPAAAEHGIAADRFAREIVRFRIMTVSVPGDGEVGFVFCGTDRVLKC